MDTTLPFPSNFQRVFNKATASNSAALVASINAQPDFWLENLKALQKSYTELTALNTILTEGVYLLKGVDEELATACESVAASKNFLNQAFRAYTVYKDWIAELTEQLQLAQVLNLNLAAPVAPIQARPSPNHSDPDKFNRDKTKLEAFVTQLCIKLQRNADYFVRPRQNTEQNQLSYAIFCLKSDAFLQVKPYVSRIGIDIPDIAGLEELLRNSVWRCGSSRYSKTQAI